MRILAAILLSLLSTAAAASDLQPAGTAAAEKAMVVDAAPTGAAMSGDALQCGAPIVIDNADAASAIKAKALGDTDAHADHLGDLPAAVKQSIAGLAAAFSLDEGLIGRAYFAGLCQRLAEKGIGPGDAKPVLTAVAQALGLTYPPSEAAAAETPPAEAKPEAPVVAMPAAPEPPQIAAAPEAASPAPAPVTLPAAESAPPPPAPAEAAPAQPEASETKQIAAAEPRAAAAPPPAAEPQPASPAPADATPADPGTAGDKGVASTEPPAAPAPAPAPSVSAPEAPPHVAEAPAQPPMPSEYPVPPSEPEPASPAAPPAEQPAPRAAIETPAPAPGGAAPPPPVPVGAKPVAPAAPAPQTPAMRSAAPGTLGEEECRALGVLGNCPDLNAVLDRLLEKPLEYNHPKTMLLGRKTEIGLVLRTDWQGKDMPPEVSEELKGLPGEVKQGLSKITRVMSAELMGRDFEISPAARQERTVAPPQPVNWIWQVSPTDTGSDKTLKLRLYAHIQGPDGTMPPLLVKTLDASIKVDVTTWDWLVIQARTLEPVYAIGAALLGLLTAILTYFLARRRETAPAGNYPESGGYFDPSTRYSGPVIGDLGQSATDSRSPAPKATEAPPAVAAPETPPALGDAASPGNGPEPKKD